MYKSYKGVEDKFGQNVAAWQYVESALRKLCRDFHFTEIRTPALEYTELFTRGVGETTDIVTKEMFTLTDRGGRNITLKPENTAGVVRAYIEHGMKQLPQPVKLYYIQPCYRAERPQKGRDIEFFQFGAEYIGSGGPLADAEVISLASEMFVRLGIKGVKLYINSLGCADCREKYNNELKRFIGNNIEALCPTCRERFEKNPLRVLDCKNKACRDVMDNAPLSADSLDDDCREHFGNVQVALRRMGIDFIVDKKLVRGLDYYTRTVFEFKSDDLGAQSTVCGGGRYDGLVGDCGGDDAPAVGFAAGIGRLIIIMQEQGLMPKHNPSVEIFIGSACKEGELRAAALCYEMRTLGRTSECETAQRSVKAQMKHADRMHAAYSIIIGDNELKSDRAVLKSMITGAQIETTLTAEAIIDGMRCVDSVWR